MKNKLDILSKSEDENKSREEQNSKYFVTKRKINSICKALCMDSENYEPQKTIENISSYIKSTNRMNRILYSLISNFVFSLDTNSRGVFSTNVDKLFFYVLDEKNHINTDVINLVTKIYDHFQLVISQIENANSIFENSIENAKFNLQKEIKGIEKNYISILGIFASIMLAFVGGITFSSSVLQNIDKVSSYRLIFVIILLAITLMNTIHFLLKFILHINDKEKQLYNIKSINVFLIILMTIIFVCWFLDLYSLQQYIKEILPWCKNIIQ